MIQDMPSTSVLKWSIRGMAVGVSTTLMVGCLASILEAQDPSTALEKCRQEARASYYADGGGSVEASLKVYERCKAREGVL